MVGAVILAAGKGRRMGSRLPKQYLPLLGRPLLAYALMAYEKSLVDRMVLVVDPDDRDRADAILRRYQIHKVGAIVTGGRERYDSVYAGLLQVDEKQVLIHDGARALIRTEEINAAVAAVSAGNAYVMGMPVKDTIKEVGEDQSVVCTPDRSRLWQVQTPQCFLTEEIRKAYRKYLQEERSGVTDDAAVYELMTGKRVCMIEGSYENLKVTTPEDLLLAEMILCRRGWKKDNETGIC